MLALEERLLDLLLDWLLNVLLTWLPDELLTWLLIELRELVELLRLVLDEVPTSVVDLLLPWLEVLELLPTWLLAC